MDRRDFLKVVAAAGAAAGGIERAAAATSDETDPLGVLVDTTMCAGCRNCELVCAEANGLPEPDLDDAILADTRKPSDDSFSVINRYETDAGEIFVKRQCMHCVQPACVSACLTRAMTKQPDGPVVWHGERCMGCRFCMVSCPFDMPTFEYDSPNPRIRKCTLCFERLAQGEQPACVESCPAEALTFGRRSELLHEARRRIYASPDEYHPAIYGEHEAGGTSWLYLSSVPFDQIGFRTDLADTAYPGFTKEFLYGVPVVLTLAPAFLLALSAASRQRVAEAELEDER